MQTLNPVTLAFDGQQLIEASAGTGKTYTITGLYLRYLLGLYEDAQGNQGEPLTVEQILVVTFTEAATSEIKDRVRSRISMAKNMLLGEHSSDALLRDLIAQLDDRQQAFNRLDMAAKSLDESAIYTIHGFCQRMLKQHAFESNMAFNLRFTLDESELHEQAVFDFWRQFVYPLRAEQAQAVLAHYSSPHSLLKELRALINRKQLQLQPHIDDPEAELTQLWHCQSEYLKALPQFKQALREGDFFNAIAASDIKGNAKPKHKSNLAGLAAFSDNDDTQLSLGAAKHSFSLWSAQSLEDPSIYKKNGQPFSHPLVVEFERMAQLSQGLGERLAQVICVLALAYVRRHVQSNKARTGIIAPDDLLSQLYDALHNDSDNQLQQQIRRQYPVAMIDEFQDTDPIQYGIFSTIYRPSDEQFTNLTMIGDPKQAIYGFRGADIFTYIDAKQQLSAQQQYTLAKNFRSATPLVESVNNLFSSHPQSFIFNDAIPYQEVEANGKDKALLYKGEALGAMDFVFYGSGAEVLSKEQGQSALAEAFAKRVHFLLAAAQQGDLLLGETPPCAGDFCILVRDRGEAALMKQALTRQGVASVYLARESVFKQPLAQHLYRLLAIIHGPYDERALRGLLAGPFYNFNSAQLLALSDDAEQWQQQLQHFAELKRRWYRDGALAMLEQLLWQNQLPQVWAEQGWDVERLLTDFRHLGEILQHKQLELDGTARLLKYFHQQLTRDSSEGDSAQLRLESDAQLVQIVTMHASKGLEYPIVFMPFAVNFRSASAAYYHHQGQLYLDLSKQQENLARAERERLAEDLRLLYVALTRPIYHCALGLYNLGKHKRSQLLQSALGYLLFPGAEGTENVRELLQARLAPYPDMSLTDADHYQSGESLVQENAAVERQVRAQQAVIERNWRATSFSALSFKHSDYHGTSHSGGDDEDHRLQQSLVLKQALPVAQLTAYDFPKGPGPGSALHDILEQISFRGVLAGEAQAMEELEQVITHTLHKYALDESWHALLCSWMAAIMRCPILESGLYLGQLQSDDCLVEMEFHLALNELDAQHFNATMISLFGYDFGLDFEHVKGVLKGFIDLIFCYQGRYYVLDYKSNYLGESADDYNDEALTHAMNAHSYHVQGAIYMVALHRLLAARLPDYDPAKHLGGMVYTFLRAMPEGHGVYYRPFSVAEIDTLDGLFAKGAHYA